MVLSPAERALEFDDVDPAGAGAGIPVHQSDGVSGGGARDAPALDVNGGVDLHG